MSTATRVLSGIDIDDALLNRARDIITSAAADGRELTPPLADTLRAAVCDALVAWCDGQDA